VQLRGEMPNKNEYQFSITVGTAPGSSRPLEETFAQEIQMLKFALLYGDCVTLCSLLSLSMNDYNIFLAPTTSANFSDKIAALDRLIAGSNEEIGTGKILENIKGMIYQFCPQGQLGNIKRRHRKALFKLMNSLGRVPTDLYNRTKWHEILAAIKTGRVNLKTVSHEKLIEIYRLKSRGFAGNLQKGKDFVTEYYSPIFDSIQDSITYPFMDQVISEVVREIANDYPQVWTPAKEIANKHVSVASAVLGRLPHFDLASIDEIEDIRRELISPLVRFRAAISTYARNVEAEVWSDDFAIQIEQYFIEQVRPSLLEIEEAIQENEYLRRLSSRFLNTAAGARPATIGIGGGIVLTAISPASFISYATLVAMLGMVGWGLLNALAEGREYYSSRREIERNQMYFYYAVHDRLALR